MRLRIIKSKLTEKFESALDAFSKIDKDGGGTLERTEIAVGLFRLGIWLSPIEIEALMNVLDEDQGGDVSFQEWYRFWKLNIDLDTGTLRADDVVEDL
ncbi:hypothetical protein GUITHDRAFT_102065 [Guillardia theta CCMP2712]|uniref:EF-hand domain-containing protein n=1 Tax=Guillardia theta (strain CCMP2712) TaxID=905079 RepID=L1JVN8_GUITC|nr:hypothetical protein GUITHDRAFT_102065 [Guillardia theta CCMP2712]EKX52163.1 hypothetical protein GUITHDRAFT_102065 [Guillardia theta CCMP2712]|eukprot:XP_005839143.1 hypothetical protein GUITHDRAFT_102065 [Guillardia theta CCMP2712]